MLYIAPYRSLESPSVAVRLIRVALELPWRLVGYVHKSNRRLYAKFNFWALVSISWLFLPSFFQQISSTSFFFSSALVRQLVESTGRQLGGRRRPYPRAKSSRKGTAFVKNIRALLSGTMLLLVCASLSQYEERREFRSKLKFDVFNWG